MLEAEGDATFKKGSEDPKLATGPANPTLGLKC